MWKALAQGVDQRQGNQWKPQVCRSCRFCGCPCRARVTSGPHARAPSLDQRPGSHDSPDYDPARQGVLPWGGERPPLPWSEMWALNPGKTWAGAGEDSILLTLRNTVSVLCALVPAPGHLPAQLLTQDGAQASLMAVPMATGTTIGHQVPQTPLGAGTGTYLEHESFPGASAQANGGLPSAAGSLKLPSGEQT